MPVVSLLIAAIAIWPNFSASVWPTRGFLAISAEYQGNGNIELNLANPSLKSVTVGTDAFCQKTKLADSTIVKYSTGRLSSARYIIIPPDGNEILQFNAKDGELRSLRLPSEVSAAQYNMIPMEMRFRWECILGLADNHGNIEASKYGHFSIWQIGVFGIAGVIKTLPNVDVPGGAEAVIVTDDDE